MIKTPSAEEKLNAVICGARAVLEKQSFAEAAREIFDRCCEMTGAVSGYVALLSPDGQENRCRLAFGPETYKDYAEMESAEKEEEIED